MSTNIPTAIARQLLHDGWTLRSTSTTPIGVVTAKATVPGVVHTDLLAAGLIPDPVLDDNGAGLAWIGSTDWTYETSFTVQASADRHELVFEGLDTVATVELNDIVIGEVANQHRTYRFDVTAILTTGENRLQVRFRAPVPYANAQSVKYGARPRPYSLPYEAIRKSACNFGWDWGLATFTSGIWRPVVLESWSKARLSNIRVSASAAGRGGTVTALVDVIGSGSLSVELEVDGVVVSVPVDAGVAAVSVELNDVERWWPAGHGAQPLYEVSVRLCTPDAVVDQVTRRVGFRTVRWDTAPDEFGHPFQLYVNERAIFVQGVNWIPDDLFFPRVDRARYAKRLGQAQEAGINLVRVWGGGIYEADDYYDLCDELGLLTWQDFLFACAAYPEDEPLRSEIEAEARDNVTRIAHHSSLVLLNGNNENLWGYEDWGWQALLDGRTWGAHYYEEMLPDVVAELAPHVDYTPGSPFSPMEGDDPNSEEHGSSHLWRQWNDLDWSTYRDHAPRFVAEFGWQGPPTWTTMTGSISDMPLTPESPGMTVHQKAPEGNTKLANGLVKHYRVPDDIENWHWAMQLNQANAVGAALDHFRSHEPRNSGAIVWQLNDCWPVTSWAAIDGHGREKPLYFALKNSFATRLITIQPRLGSLFAIISNHSDVAWTGSILLSRKTYSGETLAAETVMVSVTGRATERIAIPLVVASAADPASELVVAELAGVRGLWFFAEPRDSALAPVEFEVSVEERGAETAVTVSPNVFARDVTLLIDRVDSSAWVDSGLVTLFAGEEHTFLVRGTVNVVDPAQISVESVLRSGNQLV